MIRRSCENPTSQRRGHRLSGGNIGALGCHGSDLIDADEGYQRPRVASPIRVEIVRKLEGQVGFAVHARRWVVERFFAWINRNRRLAKDVEATIASAEAFLYAASAIIMLRRLAR